MEKWKLQKLHKEGIHYLARNPENLTGKLVFPLPQFAAAILGTLMILLVYFVQANPQPFSSALGRAEQSLIWQTKQITGIDLDHKEKYLAKVRSVNIREKINSVHSNLPLLFSISLEKDETVERLVSGLRESLFSSPQNSSGW